MKLSKVVLIIEYKHKNNLFRKSLHSFEKRKQNGQYFLLGITMTLCA